MIDLGRLQAALQRGRTAQRARAQSVCDIRVVNPPREWATGPDGLETPTYTVLHTAVPCRLDSSGTNSSREIDVGSSGRSAATRVIHLPHDVRIVDGAIFHIYAGEWADTFWEADESAGSDQKTTHRVSVIDIPAPEGW